MWFFFFFFFKFEIKIKIQKKRKRKKTLRGMTCSPSLESKQKKGFKSLTLRERERERNILRHKHWQLGINIGSKLIWCSMELLGLRVFLKFYSMMQQELLSQVHSILTKIYVPNKEKGEGRSDFEGARSSKAAKPRNAF